MCTSKNACILLKGVYGSVSSAYQEPDKGHTCVAYRDLNIQTAPVVAMVVWQKLLLPWYNFFYGAIIYRETPFVDFGGLVVIQANAFICTCISHIFNLQVVGMKLHICIYLTFRSNSTNLVMHRQNAVFYTQQTRSRLLAYGRGFRWW